MTAKVRKLKNSQRVRIIIDSVHIWTTVKAIRARTVGDNVRQNDAYQAALANLNTPIGPGLYSYGIAGRWFDHNIQLDII